MYKTFLYFRRTVSIHIIVPSFISYFIKLFFTASLFFLSHLSNLFQSDTEFWDKMQAEWEELARRNWLTENELSQVPSNVSPYEKVKEKKFKQIISTNLNLEL